MLGSSRGFGDAGGKAASAFIFRPWAQDVERDVHCNSHLRISAEDSRSIIRMRTIISIVSLIIATSMVIMFIP